MLKINSAVLTFSMYIQFLSVVSVRIVGSVSVTRPSAARHQPPPPPTGDAAGEINEKWIVVKSLC